jgi:hypothetical protein
MLRGEGKSTSGRRFHVGRRLSIAVAVTCASLLIVGLAGTALAGKDTYIGGGGYAKVKVEKNDPKKVVVLDTFVQTPNGADHCGDNYFASAKFRDLRVRNDRFDGSKGEVHIEAKFTRNANKFKGTISTDEGCESDRQVWTEENSFGSQPPPSGF